MPTTVRWCPSPSWMSRATRVRSRIVASSSAWAPKSRSWALATASSDLACCSRRCSAARTKANAHASPVLTTCRSPSAIGIPTWTNGTSSATTTAQPSGSSTTACTTTTTSSRVLPTPGPGEDRRRRTRAPARRPGSRQRPDVHGPAPSGSRPPTRPRTRAPRTPAGRIEPLGAASSSITSNAATASVGSARFTVPMSRPPQNASTTPGRPASSRSDRRTLRTGCAGSGRSAAR